MSTEQHHRTPLSLLRRRTLGTVHVKKEHVISLRSFFGWFLEEDKVMSMMTSNRQDLSCCVPNPLHNLDRKFQCMISIWKGMVRNGMIVIMIMAVVFFVFLVLPNCAIQPLAAARQHQYQDLLHPIRMERPWQSVPFGA